MIQVVDAKPEAPTHALSLLALAIKGFLEDPESPAGFQNLDWAMIVVAAMWGSYSSARRVEGAKTPIA